MDSTKVREETQDKLAIERHFSHNDVSSTVYRRLVKRGYITTDGEVTPKGKELREGIKHLTKVAYGDIEISVWQDDGGLWSYMFSNGVVAGSSEGYDIEHPYRSFFIHVNPHSRRVILLAKWER